MFNIAGGTIFGGEYRPQAQTKSLGVSDFLKVMGQIDNLDGEYKPYDAVGELKLKPGDLQTGTDQTELFYKLSEDLNNFGMSLHAKGIDVTNPSSNNPQHIQAIQTFNRKKARLDRHANALAVGQKLAMKYADKIGQQGIHLDPLNTKTATTVNELNEKELNFKSFQDDIIARTKLVQNAYVKPFDSFSATQNANSEIERHNQAMQQEIEQYRKANNLSQEWVDQHLSPHASPVGKAIYDDHKQKQIDLNEQYRRDQLAAKNANEAAKIQQRKSEDRTRRIKNKTSNSGKTVVNVDDKVALIRSVDDPKEYTDFESTPINEDLKDTFIDEMILQHGNEDDQTAPPGIKIHSGFSNEKVAFIYEYKGQKWIWYRKGYRVKVTDANMQEALGVTQTQSTELNKQLNRGSGTTTTSNSDDDLDLGADLDNYKSNN